MVNKKTKIKSLLIALTVIIILSVITVGLFWFTGSNSKGKIQYANKNAKEIEQITANSVDAIDKIDTQKILNGDEESNQKEITLPVNEQNVLNQELAKMDDAKKQELLKSLAASYSIIMQQQKTEALNMLENLIAQGKSEWDEIVAKGEDTPIVKGEKISEYFAMVNVMEKNMDASVNTVLATMEKQMEAEGIEAKPIINQYMVDYQNIKEANRGAMFDKAIEAIKGNK